MSDEMKLYTLQTSAPYDVVRTVAIDIAMKHGHVAELSEAPAEAVVVVPRYVWTPVRHWLVLLTLAGSPFVFRHLPEVTALQGYGIGWIVAALVLLARR